MNWRIGIGPFSLARVKCPGLRMIRVMKDKKQRLSVSGRDVDELQPL